MILLRSTADVCQFKENDYYKGIYIGVWINNHFICYIPVHFENNEKILDEIFTKWLQYNYPYFCKNPIGWLFGGKKCYNWRLIEKRYEIIYKP